MSQHVARQLHAGPVSQKFSQARGTISLLRAMSNEGNDFPINRYGFHDFNAQNALLSPRNTIQHLHAYIHTHDKIAHVRACCTVNRSSHRSSHRKVELCSTPAI